MTLLTGESCVKYEWTEHQFRIEHTKGLVTRVTSSCIMTNTFRIPPPRQSNDECTDPHWPARAITLNSLTGSVQSRCVFCTANDLDLETNREFGRVKKLISRERLTVQNRGREGEERTPCPPLFNCLIAASSWWWPRSICSSGSHFR